MISDLRFALRQLTKSPGFAVVAIATLALGIGACAAMFSIANAVLLKPLPFRDPERLVWIENTGTGGLSARTSRVDVFNGWRSQNKSFESLSAYFAFSDYMRMTLTGSGEPQRLRAMWVTDAFLPTLGVNLALGRNFTKEECGDDGPRAVILNYGYWQTRFAGDPGVVGRVISLNNNPTTVVGVMPATFDFSSVFTPGSPVELIAPFPLTDRTNGMGNVIFGVGRLRPGVSVAAAQAELSLISDRLRLSTLKNVGGFGAVASPLSEAVRGNFKEAFYILAGAVACVLAIACVNLSNLLLARVNARRQEFAVRVALGAGRRHLVQQTLIESTLLALAGSVIGLPLAMFSTRALAQMQTFGVPMLQNATVDGTALLFTIGVTTLAGVASGLLPALHLSSQHGGPSMQNATRQRSASRSSVTVRNALVVLEIALACMLLVGAGLLFRSFGALLKVDLGFQPEHAMAWRVDRPMNMESPVANQYLDNAVRAISALPGVETVGLGDTLPLGRNRTWGVGATGVQYPPGAGPTVFPRIVDEHYLQAMRIPLKEGRYFDSRDTAKSEKTVIINEHMARELWPGRDAIGQSITQDGGRTVVGVVEDVRHGSLEESGSNEMYIDYHQSGDWGGMEMVVRSSRPTESLAKDVRAAFAAYDPAMPSGEYYELERLVDNAVAPRRLITRMLELFSGLALVLAALGLYGVIAYSVTQRTQEIGIRIAVGAQRRDVLDLILRDGVKLAVVGVVLGLAGALVLSRLLESLLYGVSAHDPLIFVGNAVVLLAVATLACIVPALRATRVDPIEALRAD
jgi:predicted permease